MAQPVTSDQYVGHGTDDGDAFPQHKLDKARVLFGDCRQFQSLRRRLDLGKIDHATFRLGQYLLRDDQHVAVQQRPEPCHFQSVLQQDGQIVTGTNFSHAGQRVN